MRIPDYPAPDRALDGTELLPIWEDGQQRTIQLQALWSLAAAQNPAFKGNSSGWILSPVTRTALAAVVAPTLDQAAFLTESGYAGAFIFNTANLTVQVSADQAQYAGGRNYVAPASDTTGASGAWVRTLDRRDFVHVMEFGAVGDGATDDTTAITAAIAAAGAGGTVLFGAKTYLVSSTLVISLNGTKLIGSGDGDMHDTGTPISAPTILRWNGAAGGTVIKVKSAGTQFIAGNEIRGIFLDGNSALAAVGLNLVGTRLGTFDVVGDHFSTAILKMDPDTTLAEAQGCSENRIIRLSGYQTNVGDGAHLLQTSTATYNCSQNLFQLISGDFHNNYAIDIQGSDSETFEVVKLFSANGATGVRLKAGATALQATRNNMFHYLAITPATTCIPLIAEGTADGTYAAVENNILFLDTANNPTAPTVHAGASLWWGTVRSPIGLRSLTMAVGSQVQIDASGKITQSGISPSIAAGATGAAIALPVPLTTGAIFVSVQARTTPSFACADSSTTQLVIKNGAGGAATDFYWKVEGY